MRGLEGDNVLRLGQGGQVMWDAAPPPTTPNSKPDPR